MAGGAAWRSPWSGVREAPQRLGAELATDGQGEAPSSQAQQLAGGAGGGHESSPVGSLSSPSLCFSFFLRFSARCKLKFSVFRVFHTNVANGSHECFKEILDVVILHMFHTHVANMFFGCCILQRGI
jgi:hypothetical protein